jgi:N-acetylglucosaminyl-diphospho-decaprenol L-rhamnosyltransferase
VVASRPVVSVVVVNWNAGPALDRCLASLTADSARGAEVVVVDNASTDGSTVAATRDRPWARVVRSDTNVGFARGANAGAAAARGDVLVFVNPDAEVEPGAVSALVQALTTVPRAGIAGGGLVDDTGRWQPGAARFGVVAHLLLDTTLGRLASRGTRSVRTVDWVYGTFMAVRREPFVQLGGFDGAYFLYGEDLDLCHRAAAAGWRTVHVPDARARHAHNVSATSRFGLGRDAAVVEGEIRFYARRRGAAAAGVYRAVAGVKFGVKALLAAATGRPTAARRAALVVGVCLGARARAAA